MFEPKLGHRVLHDGLGRGSYRHHVVDNQSLVPWTSVVMKLKERDERDRGQENGVPDALSTFNKPWRPDTARWSRRLRISTETAYRRTWTISSTMSMAPRGVANCDCPSGLALPVILLLALPCQLFSTEIIRCRIRRYNHFMITVIWSSELKHF